MFSTEFLLRVLDNSPYYYEVAEKSICNYSGTKGAINAIKSRVAIINLLSKNPNALFQYIIDKKFIKGILADNYLDKNNADVLISMIIDSPTLFKLALKKGNQRLVGEALLSTHNYLAEKNEEYLNEMVRKNPKLAKELCKGMLDGFIVERKKSEEYWGNSHVFLEHLLSRIEKDDNNEIDYAFIYDRLTHEMYKDIYVYIVDNLCHTYDEKVEEALWACDVYSDSNNSKEMGVIRKRVERGIITPEELKGIFEFDMNLISTHVNSVMLSNSCALGNMTLDKQKEVSVKDLTLLLILAKKRFSSEDKKGILPEELDEGKVVLNMMLAFGTKHARELLEGQYGDFSPEQLNEIFGEIDPNEFDVTNKTVNYNDSQKAMQRFLFGNGVKDPNSNIRRILGGEIQTDLAKLVKNWKLLHAISYGKVKITEIDKLLEDSIPFLHEYQEPLRGVITEAGVDKVPIIMETYDTMLQRSESTIPKVKGKVGDLEYEVLDLDSVEQMSVGYVTKCCFTFEGASSSSLRHALTSKDGRIMVIRKNGQLVAQSWLWRNGNVLCFDDIETIGVSRRNDEEYLQVCVEASKELLKASEQIEPAKEKIEICTVGISPNQQGVQSETAEKSLSKLEWENTILPTGALYTDAHEQYVLGKSPSYKESRRFTPSMRYGDDRPKTTICDPQQSSKEEIELTKKTIFKVDGISKASNESSVSDFTFVIYGKDWYIGISHDGEITERKVGKDKRQQDEITSAYQLIKDKSQSGELTVFLNDGEVKTEMEAKANGTK